MDIRWRIIDSGPADPFTNMAFDEALLCGYSLYNSPPTLRIYGWDPPALSIGCSQDPVREIDTEFCSRVSMPIVRRITGGGMIMHADEITYSIVCSKRDLAISDTIASSYKTICSFLINFYKALGLDAAFACDAMPGERLGSPSALCFAAKEKYDIVIGGRKIGGSAQKRSKNVIFQHGSIPIACAADRGASYLSDKSSSGSAAGSTSLSELLAHPVNASGLSDLLIESFKTTFKVNSYPGGLSGIEKGLLEELRAGKYESREWNLHRTGHLPAGEIINA